jgi:DNA polymerase-3 subunit epsilon
MDLNLKNPIVFFDLEATGLNIAEDRIVEISLLKVNVDGSEELKTYRVNPEIPIPKKVTDIHGITDEDIKNEPAFKEIASEIAKFIKGCDLGGFNSNKFDIPLLAEEFIRAGVDIDLKKRKFVDVQTIFFKMEKRDLKSAYKFYLDKELENSHSAQADTVATYEILKAQLERYEKPERKEQQPLKNDVDYLAGFSSFNKNADFVGRIVYNDKNEEVFNFGKYKGKKVEDVLEKDPGYYGWMMNGDFPEYTKKVLTEIKLRKLKK